MTETFLSKEKAVARGFRVDSTVYPWLAYKGRRFATAESADVLTDLEAELYEALTELLHDYDPEDAVIRVEPDPGCILCTKGVTPNDKNTGLCSFHKAEKAMKQARGES